MVWFANHFVFSLDGPSPHSMTSFLKETCRKSHDFLLHFCQKCSGLFRWFPSMGSTKFFFCNREYFFLTKCILYQWRFYILPKIVKSSSSLKVFILYKLGQKVCNFDSPKIVWIILSPCLNIKDLFIVTIVMYIFIQKRSVIKHLDFLFDNI